VAERGGLEAAPGVRIVEARVDAPRPRLGAEEGGLRDDAVAEEHGLSLVAQAERAQEITAAGLAGR
jgi:hypothetical protein